MTNTNTPSDLDAEQAVLGAMLLFPDTIHTVANSLGPSDFYRPAHRIIFQTITDLHTRSEAADPIAVASNLSDSDKNAIGGTPYLHTLITTVDTPTSARSNAETVKGAALQRHLIETGTRITQLGYAAETSAAAAALEQAQAELDALSPKGDRPTPFNARLADALDTMEAAGPNSLPGVPTGLKDLDALTGGLRAGQVHTVFGATGVGSSLLALNFVGAATIKHGFTTALFSGQSPAEEVTNRMLAAEARVPCHAMRTGTMQDQEWTRMAHCLSEVTDAPLIIHDNAAMTFAEISAECRRLKRQDGLRLVVIDGVNLYARPTAPETLWAAQARLSADIKRLAVELKVPIVVTAPTNRRAENRFDRRPTYADIASSSAYAADSDVLIGVHREDAYEKESPRAGEADLIVLKNRHGMTATVTVAFQGHYCRFVDLTPMEPLGVGGLRPVPEAGR